MRLWGYSFTSYHNNYVGGKYSEINGRLKQINNMSAWCAIHFDWYAMYYVVKNTLVCIYSEPVLYTWN